MNLKEIFSQDKKAKSYFWALVIEPGWVQAGVWEVEGEEAQVTSMSPPTPWADDADLIGATDTALSAAIQLLPEEIGEPSKTVFGVPPSWVEGGQIASDYLERIKKICSQLALEPAGFVVLPEAIAHLIKSQEGAPLSSIVIGIGMDNIELAVFKLGNLIGSTSIARSVSVSDDVIEGLARFAAGESLPSRFIIYDGKEGELEDVRQALLGVSWEENEKVKFLHTPKIEILEPDRKVLAVALAGGSEIAHVASVKSLKQTEEEPFEEENIEAPKEPVRAEELGFVIGEDIAKDKKPPQEPIGETPPVPTQMPQEKEGIIKKFSFVTGFLGNLRGKISGFLSKKEPVSIGEAKGKKLLITGGIILATLLVGGFIFWWFYPKATVTIYVSPQKLEEKIAVSVVTEGENSDFSKGILAGEVHETKVSGEKTKTTTGTKKVGEKARGSVEIQNGTAGNLTISAGTILVSSGDLRFTIGSTASVSAALSPTNPGKATVDATASDIGAEYNLGKDETFKVGNYPRADVVAVSLSNFSGGSSRDISAVSQEDQTQLEEELTQELLEKAKSELGMAVGTESFFIKESATHEVGSRSFSNKIGDEASNLKLNMELSVVAVSIPRKDMFELAKKALEGKVPGGYALREDQIDLGFELSDEEDGIFELETNVSVNLLPEIKPEEIAKKIAGKYPPLAESFLQSIPGFTRADIKFKPRLPGRLGTLPRLPKNITIEVAAER